MRRDHRPLWLRNIHAHYERWWADYFLVPQFDRIGEGAHIKLPWNLELVGPCIEAGRHLHVICEAKTTTRFSTWTSRPDGARILIGNHVLISPGVQLLAASSIEIGNNAMLAAHVYVSDGDWHGLYDRIRDPASPTPIVIGENAWIGTRAIIGKGVTIGANSVIGAGSVVVSDVPANTVAAGNPARVIKTLDADIPLITRQTIFGTAAEERQKEDFLYGMALADNSFFRWLKARFSPSQSD